MSIGEGVSDGNGATAGDNWVNAFMEKSAGTVATEESAPQEVGAVDFSAVTEEGPAETEAHEDVEEGLEETELPEAIEAEEAEPAEVADEGAGENGDDAGHDAGLGVTDWSEVKDWSKEQCKLKKPGEELGNSEKTEVKIILSCYRQKLLEGELSQETLHVRIIDALGGNLNVPGLHGNEGETTQAQKDRLEELYRIIVEKEKETRSAFEKFRLSKKAQKAAGGVLAAAALAALTLSKMFGGASEAGYVNPVAISEESEKPTEGGELVAEVEKAIDNLDNPEAGSN